MASGMVGIDCASPNLGYVEGTIRYSVVDKLRVMRLSKDDRLLYKHGLIYETGQLTRVGEQAVLQTAFDLTRDDLVKGLREVEAEEKKK